MANYQELLSKAVGALPENNGASRREVYEKARKALVGQLRSISPPLPAREITQHRLELEDCIRQVEHEATELLLGELKGLEEETIPLSGEELPASEESVEPAVVTESEPTMEAAPAPNDVSGEVAEAALDSGANGAEAADVESAERPQKPDTTETPQEKSGDAPGGNSIDAIIARAEAAREKATRETVAKEAETAAKKAEAAAREAERVAEEEQKQAEDLRIALEEDLSEEAGATKNIAADSEVTPPAPAGAAMSEVREVEVEGIEPVSPVSFVAGPRPAPETPPAVPAVPVAQEPSGKGGANGENKPEDQEEDVAQLAVDRAIQTLDREARGEHDPDGDDGSLGVSGQNGALTSGEARYDANGDEEEKGGGGLTIFLVLAIVLLGAVGGGGYWAWREGYVDLDALFASSQAPVEEPLVDTGAENPQPGADNVQTPVESNPIRNVTPQSENTGPGNTATDVEAIVAPAELEAAADNNKSAERLVAEGGDVAEPSGGAGKAEDRLVTDPQPELSVGGPGADSELSTAPSGAQSLLLEASADGTTGAVPFSGTVSWSRGVDELGQPTLIGEAKIPARNLGVKVLIRRNGDPSLPASHLLEIDFDVSETFSGGSVAGLPGILLKNQELVQGAALVGASARVVGNSFLFALSAAEQDVRNNVALLEDNKWMDIAIIYSTGRRAIITLEKDDEAQAMFREVLAIWQAEAAGNG